MVDRVLEPSLFIQIAKPGSQTLVTLDAVKIGRFTVAKITQEFLFCEGSTLPDPSAPTTPAEPLSPEVPSSDDASLVAPNDALALPLPPTSDDSDPTSDSSGVEPSIKPKLFSIFSPRSNQQTHVISRSSKTRFKQRRLQVKKDKLLNTSNLQKQASIRAFLAKQVYGPIGEEDASSSDV